MRSVLAAIIAVLIFTRAYITTTADEYYVEPQYMRITCYLPTGNKTADGTIPHYGICAAKRSWIGKTAVLYDVDMRLIGYFEIRDTGGHERIKNGSSIDLFMESWADAQAYIKEHGDYGYVQIIDADG